MPFSELVENREAVLAQPAELASELDSYLQYPLNKFGSELDLWVAKAKAEGEQLPLLVHAGVRWWLARDDLLSRPAHARVPCDYSNGAMEHFSLQHVRRIRRAIDGRGDQAALV